MIKNHWPLLSLPAWLLLAALLTQPTGAKAADALPSAEEAASAAVETMMEGWNAGSGERFAQPFGEDATYRVWNGLFAEGREQIASSHQQIFDTFYAGTTLSLSVERVRPLTDRVALAYVRGQVLRDGRHVALLEGMEGAVPVLVLVLEGDRWKVAHFQNTPMLRR